MIDRQARRELTSALKKLAIGRISNEEFQDQIASLKQSPDDAVAESACYADEAVDADETIQYSGKNAMSREDRRQIARLILFLHGSQDIEPPNGVRRYLKRYYRIVIVNFAVFVFILLVLSTLPGGPLLALITILIWIVAGWFSKFPNGLKAAPLENQIWPFNSHEDFELALRQPILGAKRI